MSFIYLRKYCRDKILTSSEPATVVRDDPQNSVVERYSLNRSSDVFHFRHLNFLVYLEQSEIAKITRCLTAKRQLCYDKKDRFVSFYAAIICIYLFM